MEDVALNVDGFPACPGQLLKHQGGIVPTQVAVPNEENQILLGLGKLVRFEDSASCGGQSQERKDEEAKPPVEEEAAENR